MLCAAIDQILSTKPKNFDEFLQQLIQMEYEVKNGKNLAFRKQGKARLIRLRSLGNEYSEDAIRAVISGKTLHKAKNTSKQVHTQRAFHLLIDIQTKMAEGKSVGYERWAKKYNRKEAARTVCLLKEKGVDSYEELTTLTEKLSIRFNELSGNIKSAEKRMIEMRRGQDLHRAAGHVRDGRHRHQDR